MCVIFSRTRRPGWNLFQGLAENLRNFKILVETETEKQQNEYEKFQDVDYFQEQEYSVDEIPLFLSEQPLGKARGEVVRGNPCGCGARQMAEAGRVWRTKGRMSATRARQHETALPAAL